MKGFALLVVVGSLISIAGCGGGNSSTTTPSTVSVTISPAATQTITQAQTVSYTAVVHDTDSTTGVVTNDSNQTVTWQVNGETGGDSVLGVISTAGVYTAPPTVTNAFVITITAVSAADATAAASASIQVNPPSAVAVAPSTATVAAGQSQTFTATVLSTEMPNTVTWYVNGVAGGSSSAGFITPQGVYTAPPAPPAGGKATVAAVLDVDDTQISNATVTDTFSAASLLQCSYAFLVRGTSTRGPFLRAGSFTTDGQGNITGGIEDINGAGLPSPPGSGTSFTGTYTVGADGRGTMVFHDGFGGNFGISTDSHFTLVVAPPQQTSAQQVLLSEADVFASGEGQADLQSSCSPNIAALSGTYVFDFSGTGASAEPLSIVGEFNSVSNGAPTSGGTEDSNDSTGGLTPNASVTFAYQIPGGGSRGTATFTVGSATTNFSFYMVSANRLRFVELDSGPVVGGDAVWQQSSPGSFTLGSLGGNCIFVTNGISPSGAISTVASFSADSNGGLQPVTVVQNNAGAVSNQKAAAASINTYAVAANGRGMATLSTGQTYVFYLFGDDQGVVQETDSSVVSDGVLLSPFNSPPQLANLSGSFAFQWTGAAVSSGRQDTTGQFLVSNGQFIFGTLDRNTANAVNPTSGFTPAANITFTPTTAYQLSTDQVTITIQVNGSSLQFAVFYASPTSAVILRVDTADARVLSGTIAKQF